MEDYSCISQGLMSWIIVIDILHVLIMHNSSMNISYFI